MKKNNVNREVFQIFVLFFLVIVSPLFLTAEENYREVDYSGKTLHEALLGMAKWGKFNVLTDLPPVKIEKMIVRLEDPFFEEMLNFLGSVIPFRVRKCANVFVLCSDEKDEQSKEERIQRLVKRSRKKSELFSLFQKAFPSAKKFFCPEKNLLFLAGKYPETEDFQKFQYSHEASGHQIRISCNVEKKPEAVMIASFSFLTLGNQPFKFALLPKALDEWSFSGEGVGETNYDWVVHLKTNLRFSKNTSSEAIQLEHSLFMNDNHKGKEFKKQRIGLASGEFLIEWGAEYVNSGFLKASPATFPEIPLPGADSFGDIPEDGDSDSTEIPSGFAFLETEVSSVLEAIIASEGEKLLCDEVVSGTVTLICYGEQMPYSPLIRGIATSRGFEAVKKGNTWVVGLPKPITGMKGFYKTPFVSPRLREISAERSSKILNDLFGSLGLDGKVTFDSRENSVIVIGEDRAVKAAVNALELLERKPLMFDVGGLFRAPFGEMKEQKSLIEASPLNLYKSFENGSAAVRLIPSYLDEEDGYLRGFEYTIQAFHKSQGNVMIKGAAHFPVETHDPVVSFEGGNPFQLYVLGNIATYSYDPPSGLGSASQGGENVASDSFFDSSF